MLQWCAYILRSLRFIFCINIFDTHTHSLAHTDTHARAFVSVFVLFPGLFFLFFHFMFNISRRKRNLNESLKILLQYCTLEQRLTPVLRLTRISGDAQHFLCSQRCSFVEMELLLLLLLLLRCSFV